MSLFEGHIVNDGAPQAFHEHLSQSNQQKSPENIALFKAAKAGSMTALKKALTKGAKPNFFFNPEDSKNALHISAEEGHTDIVDELLANGAVPDCLVVGSKETALILACRTDREVIASKLITAGANINHANAYGNTSLHETVRENFLVLANYLIQAGANVTVQNNKGSTPLHFLCYASQEEVDDVNASVALGKALIAHGADVNATDNEGLTPFLVCCASGRMDLIDMLIEHGANTSVSDTKRRFATDIAEFYHHADIISRFGKSK